MKTKGSVQDTVGITAMGTGVGRFDLFIEGVRISPYGNMFAVAEALATEEKGFVVVGTTHHAGVVWAKHPRYVCREHQEGCPECDGHQVIEILPRVHGVQGRGVLRRAVRAAVMAAGSWAEKFQGGGTVYPPHVPAGIRALERQGRRDLIPALRRRCASGRYDVTSIQGARAIAP